MIVDLSQLSEPRSLHLQFFLQFQSFYLAIHLQPLGLSEGHVGVVHLLTWRRGGWGGREGGEEGGRKRGREGKREGGREGKREGGEEGGREGGREGKRKRGREGKREERDGGEMKRSDREKVDEG